MNIRLNVSAAAWDPELTGHDKIFTGGVNTEQRATFNIRTARRTTATTTTRISIRQSARRPALR